jgi:hypothetical protein
VSIIDFNGGDNIDKRMFVTDYSRVSECWNDLCNYLPDCKNSCDKRITP